MAGQLTTEQLLLLNDLMYLPEADKIHSINNYDSCATVGDIIDQIKGKFNKTYNDVSAEKWNSIINAVDKNPQLRSLRVKQAYQGAGNGLYAMFMNDEGKEAIPVFCGTANNEWKDNFIAGTATDAADGVSSKYQEEALNWYRSLDTEGYSVTVSGHSKGGNKAKYITIVDGSPDRCVSFNGQGFSDEFMYEYQDQIAERQGLIQNHNITTDYVNLLLNDIGETTFYESKRADNPVQWHYPSSYADIDSKGNVFLTPTDRSPIMATMDDMLNSYIRSLPPEERAKALALVGDIIQGALGDGTGAKGVMELMTKPGYANEVASLIAYMKYYASQKGEKAVGEICDMLGMPQVKAFIWAADGLDSILDDIKALKNKQRVDNMQWVLVHFPWLSDKIDKWLKDHGLNMTAEELLEMLRLREKVNEREKMFRKSHASGADIVIPSKGGSRRGRGSEAGAYMCRYDRLESAGTEIGQIANKVNYIISNLNSVKRNLPALYAGCKISINAISNGLSNKANTMKGMETTLKEIAKQYEGTEQRVLSYVSKS